MEIVVSEQDYLVLYPVTNTRAPNRVVPPGRYEVKTQTVSGVEWWTIEIPREGIWGKASGASEMEKLLIAQ